jgi:hypothetical protein
MSCSATRGGADGEIVSLGLGFFIFGYKAGTAGVSWAF